jgi:hypothetical protein
MSGLDTDPVFAPEAQEVFTEGCRVFVIADTYCVREGSEGSYEGHWRNGAVVRWDTPDGNGYRETVPFASIKNLYR